jgi:glycosyltransferase involved in cell wall biosynthesis
MAFAAHDLLMTYGENYGAGDCGVPVAGLSFGTTRQPVDLELWPPVFAAERPFTTIGNYRQEGGDVVFGGEVYRWSKHHEWEKFLDLPARTGQDFLLAVMPEDEADGVLLRQHGWDLVAPIPMSLDVFGAYPDFIRQSRAEFTVAKDQNVRLRSGWFSERDACYLASGKPVVAQDTGFGSHIPTGDGLFAVSAVEEAAEAVARINADYEHHCAAARAVAAECFEASSVAARLLADVGAG